MILFIQILSYIHFKSLQKMHCVALLGANELMLKKTVLKLEAEEMLKWGLWLITLGQLRGCSVDSH